MKAAELFVKCLENEGVEYIFGVPGEEDAPFWRVRFDSSSICILLLTLAPIVFRAMTHLL